MSSLRILGVKLAPGRPWGALGKSSSHIMKSPTEISLTSPWLSKSTRCKPYTDNRQCTHCWRFTCIRGSLNGVFSEDSRGCLPTPGHRRGSCHLPGARRGHRKEQSCLPGSQEGFLSQDCRSPQARRKGRNEVPLTGFPKADFRNC